jgi:hypothetical protein
MSFADPQSLTIDGVTKSLGRMPSDKPYVSSFRTADAEFELSIRQYQTNSRFRREVRLIQKKVASDPYTAVTKDISTSVTLTVDEPKWGFDDSELGNLVSAIKAWYDTTSQTKVLTGEI